MCRKLAARKSCSRTGALSNCSEDARARARGGANIEEDPERGPVAAPSSTESLIERGGAGREPETTGGQVLGALKAIAGFNNLVAPNVASKMGTDDGAKGNAAKGAKPPLRVNKASMENDEVVDGRQAEFWPTLLRALKLAKIYYYGDQKVRARVLLSVMLVLCALTTGLMVVFSYVQRDMMTALSDKNQPAFYDAINRYIIIIVIAAPLFALYNYVQNLVELEWRLWLTRLLVKKYFSKHAYFALKAEGTMDNPDQRICEDARNYVQSCNGLLLAVAQKLLSMGAFFGVLWSISPTLLVFCFGYSLFGTIVTTRLFGSKLMGLHFQALRREADLRFGLVRAREHAESIALYGGAKREAAAARGFLAIVAAVLLRKIAWSRNLALFTNAYEFATFALPSLIIAPRYFAGEVEFGVVTQAGMAFRTVQGALNIIIGRFEQLSGLAAETERLERLFELLEGLDGTASSTSQKMSKADKVMREMNEIRAGRAGTIARSVVDASGGDELALEKLAVFTPLSGRELWRDLGLTLRAGDALLVVGPSGCGKSSLLRAVAGVWTTGSGAIAAPTAEDSVFLPQAPYMPLGTLRAQLVFPASVSDEEGNFDEDDEGETLLPRMRGDFDDAELYAALDAAGLGDLPERFKAEGGLDATMEWSDVLSAGEQQRIAFARLFLRKPRCAFLDEATSALDERNEAAMYERVRGTCAAVVSVGHRSTLLKYHTLALRFEPGVVNGGGGGTWTLMRMEEYQKSLARSPSGSMFNVF